MIKYQVCSHYFNIIVLFSNAQNIISHLLPQLLPKNSKLGNATDLKQHLIWLTCVWHARQKQQTQKPACPHFPISCCHARFLQTCNIMYVQYVRSLLAPGFMQQESPPATWCQCRPPDSSMSHVRDFLVEVLMMRQFYQIILSKHWNQEAGESSALMLHWKFRFAYILA